MRKLEVNDIVEKDDPNGEGKVKGKVMAIHTKGTADVYFPNEEFVKRYQESDLTVIRNNPMKLQKVPNRIKETPRSNATNLYVFPQDQSFPIGDLYHARLALIYVLSPSHYDSRTSVIQAVHDAYPQYNWGDWWAKKSKGKDLASWDEYVNDYRIVDGQPRMVANPFITEDMARVSNPRRKSTTKEYDPSEAQFHAVVQGIYESLVKKYIGLKAKTPFKDDLGVRLDVKFVVPQEMVKELLGSAFAIATKQGQKQGTLKAGSQKATKKGKAKSKQRAKDKAHLEQNILDFETTLMLARKDQDFRIQKKGSKYYVHPNNGEFKKGYKTKAAAKGAITRHLNALDTDLEDLPMVANPMQIPDRSDKAINAFIKRTKRLTRQGTYRRPPKSKGYINEYERKLSYAKATKAYGQNELSIYESIEAKYKEKGLKGSELQRAIERDVENLRIRPSTKGQDAGMRDIPIRAEVVTNYIYLPEMTNRGEPYILYRRAPIASYYTIRLIGPSYKFQIQGDVILDRMNWRATEFGNSPFNVKADVSRNQFNEDAQFVGRRTGQKIGYADVTYLPGQKLTTENGFNQQPLNQARQDVINAYQDWYENLVEDDKIEPGKDTFKLDFPKDCLTPVYRNTLCSGMEMSVIDPFQHFGVFMRALVQVLEFKSALAIRGIERYIDVSAIEKWLEKKGLLEDVMKAIRGPKIRLQQTLSSDTTQKLSRYAGLSDKEVETAKNYENTVKEVFEPLSDFLTEVAPQATVDAKGKASSLLDTIVNEVKDGVLDRYKRRVEPEMIRNYITKQYNETRQRLITLLNVEMTPDQFNESIASMQKLLASTFKGKREDVLDREEVREAKRSKWAKSNPKRRRRRF